jgi:hypothetical protein
MAIVPQDRISGARLGIFTPESVGRTSTDTLDYIDENCSS